MTATTSHLWGLLLFWNTVNRTRPKSVLIRSQILPFITGIYMYDKNWRVNLAVYEKSFRAGRLSQV